jgi:hypothetical protein
MNPTERIDELIAGLDDWRGKTLAAARQCFLSANKDVVEEWKWMGSPVWECDGMIAVGNAHKDKVKLTFLHGSRLSDPDKLFNAGLGGGQWRAIDFLEGDNVNRIALKKLVRAAIELNRSKPKKKSARAKSSKAKKGVSAISREK